MRIGLAVGVTALVLASVAGAKGSHKYKGKPVPPKEACAKVCSYAQKQCEQDCKDDNADKKAQDKCLAGCPAQVEGCMDDCEKNMAKNADELKPPPVDIPSLPQADPQMPETPPASGDGD